MKALYRDESGELTFDGDAPGAQFVPDDDSSASRRGVWAFSTLAESEIFLAAVRFFDHADGRVMVDVLKHEGRILVLVADRDEQDICHRNDQA